VRNCDIANECTLLDRLLQKCWAERDWVVLDFAGSYCIIRKAVIGAQFTARLQQKHGRSHGQEQRHLVGRSHGRPEHPCSQQKDLAL